MANIGNNPAFAQANPTLIRLALLRNGYNPTPNRAKECYLPGWNAADYHIKYLSPYRGKTADGNVTSWEKRFSRFQATGVRVENGLIAIDLDIRSRAMIEAMLALICEIAPEVHATAPLRYGSSTKVMLFARTEEDVETFKGARLPCHRFHDPINHEHAQQVEIFTGKKTRQGKCSKQVGAYGPHSYQDDDKTVAIWYRWDDAVPALHEVPLAELPVITAKQMFAIIDAFEALATKAGWQQVTTEAPDDNGAWTYDIDDDSRFDTDRAGDGLNYAALCEAYAEHGELRCSTSFLPNRGATRRDHCVVSDENRHRTVAVYVFGDEALHFHIRDEPIGDYSQTKFGEKLRELQAALEAPTPEFEPNWRERNRGGGPVPSMHNARLAIEHSQVFCWIDLFHDRMWIGLEHHTDASIAALREQLSDRFGFDLLEKHIRDAVMILAHKNAIDPVLHMLAEAEANWDGVARLNDMAVDYFNCEDTELARMCVRKTMIAAVARVRVPGCKFDTILTMESPEGLNKSSAWAVLAGAGNFSDERVIGKDSREVQEILAGVWIHENSELAGMTKAEVETVKAFASRQVDRARPAYAHYYVDRPRRAIEVATTNANKYLMSQTGNRRFWPVTVQTSIDLVKLHRDRLQLWGEAAYHQRQGEELTLPEGFWAVAGAVQEARRVRHPWEEALASMKLAPSTGPLAGVGYVENRVLHAVDDEQRVATWAIFQHVLKLPAGQQNMGHAKNLANVMQMLGWESCVFRLEGEPVRGYRRTKVTSVTRNNAVSNVVFINTPPTV